MTDAIEWVSAREALAMLWSLGGGGPGKLNLEQRVAQLAFVAGNKLRTKAASVTVDGVEADIVDPDGHLPFLFWEPDAIRIWAKDSDWSLGTIAGCYGDTRAIAYGVMLCRNDLERLTGGRPASLADAQSKVVEMPAVAASAANGGGKASDKHGEPIARATLALFAMDDVEFGREKGVTVKTMLSDLYRLCGAQPPADKNLEGIAYGVLRVVKDARKPAL